MKKKQVITLSVILFLFLVYQVYCFLSTPYEEFAQLGAIKTEIEIEGRLIANPINKGYGRGPECYCWENSLATHLLELEEKIPNPDNPPTYLDEIWNLYDHIPESKVIKGKNVLPVFLQRTLSNLEGLLNRGVLSKHEGKRVKIKGILIKKTTSNGVDTYENRFLIIKSVKSLEND
ncbi:hypothetical protein ACFL6U_33140 [Planctomycetota bacterium]